MNKFESIISNAIERNTESRSFIFSVHDHMLSQKEARETTMFYSQAIKENKSELAGFFEYIYNTSFSLFMMNIKKAFSFIQFMTV